MLSFFIKWFINIIALFVVIHTIAGVSAANSHVVIIAALVIGLLNAFLRPILIMLTLPLTVLSLGLFTLIINAFMFYLASKFVAGFTVASFWSAFAAALLFSILSAVLSFIFVPSVNWKFNTFKSGGARAAHHDNVIDVEGEIVDKDQDKEDRSE